MTPYVLIVEDETAISTLLEYNLQQEGFETALAGDGDLALLMAEERTPDLILLDWMIAQIPMYYRMESRLEIWSSTPKPTASRAPNKSYISARQSFAC